MNITLSHNHHEHFQKKLEMQLKSFLMFPMSSNPEQGDTDIYTTELQLRNLEHCKINNIKCVN